MTPENLVDPNDPTLTPPPTTTSNTEVPPSSDLSVDTTGQQLFFATLREKNAEIERLKQEVAQKNVTPRPTGEEAWSELTHDPRRVIQEEVANAVKPLNDFVAEMRAANQWGAVKAEAARIDPQYRVVLEKAGGAVDQVLLQSKATPNLDNLIAAINLVAGAIAMGKVQGLSASDLIPGYTPPAPAPKPPTTKVMPPTIPPSAHPISSQPNKETAKPWESLSENELAMARHYRMTPEQYWRQQQGDIVEVDTTKGGGKK